MKNQTRLFISLGIGVSLLLAVALGGLLHTAFAQGPWQHHMLHGTQNNQVVLDLLNSSEGELLRERQAGKSRLQIATARGVGEEALLDTLLRPMGQMHAWMTQNDPQTNGSQMNGWMRQQIAQDLGFSHYGTMTDMHLFGGGIMGDMMSSGMMGGGMMDGGSMMGGMMDGGSMMGGMMEGMMNGRNTTPNVVATPVPSAQRVDQGISLRARNFKFDPPHVEAKKGETIRFSISNEDPFAHNLVSQNGKLAYTVLPANQTTSILWTAPDEGGTYTIICTWHPGMQFAILVE